MRQLAITLILTMMAGPIFAQVPTRKVEMEWEAVPDSIRYELEFRRYLKGGKLKKPNIFSTKTTAWSGSIQPGKYQIRIRSQDDRRVWGEWGEAFDHWVRILPPDLLKPAENEILKTDQTEKAEVEFSWSPRPGSAAYKVDILNEQGESVTSQTTKDTTLKLQLPVARLYAWQVTSIMPEAQEMGESPKTPRPFTLRGGALEPPEIVRPEDQFVERIKWQAAQGATSYQVKLSRQDKDGKWIDLQKWTDLKKTEVRLNPRFSGGLWRIEVQSSAALNENSSPRELEFNVYDGLRTPKAIAEAKRRQAIEQARDQYFIASYLLTSLDYQATFGDLGGAGLKFGAINGTGRLGYGHFARHAQWGGVAIADFSGVLINNKNYTYSSFELQGIWRTYFQGVTQMRLYGGLGYRERPFAKGLTRDSVVVTNLATADIFVGVQLWQPLSKRLGLQLNQQTYYNVSGIDLPAGASLQPALSYQLGFMGSYKLRDHITGLIGYAFRHDQIDFKAGDGTSSVKMDGHYLNLHLEWGF
ncbi:MAG: hypothetical protein AB7N80_15435 [Bdellovibrionales bacterium]